MFRSRFHAAFPSKLSHFGPQDIERGVVDDAISPQIESFLRALLGLVLNRKKPVEQGHYGRAMEEAIASHKSQWPHKWLSVNPLRGDREFNSLLPTERLNMLRTLVMWALSSSEEIGTIIKESYKQSRHADDENQPLSVQPWGRDIDKRRYFLIEGQDDTSFRVFREDKRYTKHNAQWYSVAGEIEELKALAQKLESKEYDGSQAARSLSNKMMNAVPRFEASEEVSQSTIQYISVDREILTKLQKRRRREYRQIKRAAFTRPEPGYSLYEGRTRGKRMRYTYDDDENDNFDSDATSNRRSARQSARSTPFESGPQFTASGRQVRPRQGGEYGASALSTTMASTDDLAPEYDGDGRAETEDSEDGPVRAGGRSMRTRPAVNGTSNPRKRKHINGYNDIDDMSEEDDAPPSNDEWDSDANEQEEAPDADDEADEQSGDAEEDEDDGEPKSLVVKLKIPRKALGQPVGGLNGDHNHLNGQPSPKPEPTNSIVGSALPPSPDAQTHPSAPKSEPHQVNGGLNGIPTTFHSPAAHPMLQPQTIPSAYPTPTSVVEQKSAVMPDPAGIQYSQPVQPPPGSPPLAWRPGPQ